MTIHNIGDAKFGRYPATTTGLNDGVEITRVNGPMPGGYGIGANLDVGSYRQSLAEKKNDLTATNSTEFDGESQHQLVSPLCN